MCDITAVSTVDKEALWGAQQPHRPTVSTQTVIVCWLVEEVLECEMCRQNMVI